MEHHSGGNSLSPSAASPGAPELVREPNFPLAVRGYDRRAVDEHIAALTQLVEELEGRQLHENVVQRALDQVGEETASILQRAHETADEITARSRAQAEGRIQGAERDAELIRVEADKYAERVRIDTQHLWEERQRLIDDIRRLADEVLATADDAAERVRLPVALHEEPAPEDDSPTGEVEIPTLDGPQPETRELDGHEPA